MLFDKKYIDKRKKNVKSACGKKKSVKAAVDGGWEVPDHLAHEAYDLAEEYFGTDDINQQIVDALSDTELAENLAFIFRMNDFREWDDYLEENYPEDEDDEDDDIEESVRARGRRNIKASRKRPLRKTIKAAVDGGAVTLKDMNTDVIPVADFGCYGGPLSGILEDVFDAYSVNTSNLSPDDEYYDEIVKLISEKYDGTEEFQQQVLDLAPATIQQAFDEYGIPATVVSGSCKWWHPREYNFSDDVIEFDMSIDTNWVESKFRELSSDSKFNKFLGERYSSRSGFMSFMPNNASEYEEILDPNSTDYWKLVSAIISYIVDNDPSISESIIEDLYEYIISNADFVTYSDLGLY